MEYLSLKKQFEVTLDKKSVLITTSSNNNDAYEAELNLPLGKQIKIGWHDLIQTGKNSLNYHECCGILILFGIEPPSFKYLYNRLKPIEND